RFLAAAPSRLVVISMEDALGLVEQVNVPGAVDEHPNWRRRLPVALEDLRHDARLAALAGAMRAAGRGGWRHARRAIPERGHIRVRLGKFAVIARGGLVIGRRGRFRGFECTEIDCLPVQLNLRQPSGAVAIYAFEARGTARSNVAGIFSAGAI